MKNLKHETCKLIAALGVKGETEKDWSIPVPSRGRTPTERLMLDQQTPDVFPKGCFFGDCYDVYPAYSFSELLDILPQIGEKLGGFEEMCCRSGCGCEYPNGDGSHEFSCEWEYIKIGHENFAYKLLGIYLSSGMEAVDSEMQSLLTWFSSYTGYYKK